MRRSLETIERIYNATGGGGVHGAASAADRPNDLDVLLQDEVEKQKVLEKKMEQLSPYKRTELRALLEIAKMRKTLKQIEVLNRQKGATVDQHEKLSEQMRYHMASQELREITKLKQFCRRQYRVLQDLQKDAESAFYAELNHRQNQNQKQNHSEAETNNEEAETLDFSTLNTHLENAIHYYRQVFEIAVVSSSSNLNNNNNKQFLTLTQKERQQYLSKNKEKYPNEEAESLLGDTHREDEQQLQLDYINARDDKEFENFFLLTEQKNKLIDEALDRIHVSVLRLKDNAKFISQELNVQEHLLDQTEVHIEHTQEHVRQLNKRLDVAIKELETSSVCSYLLCLLFLMFVLCLLLRVVT